MNQSKSNIPFRTDYEPADGRIRNAVYHIIFESEPGWGKKFDILLIFAILLSVLVVIVESVPSIQTEFVDALIAIEWILTGLFTVEYIVRLWCLKRPLRYAVSFFGIIDLVAILPSFIGLFVPQGRYLLVVRVLRLLRIFRILKLTHYLKEANMLLQALHSSRRKIGVFFSTVVILVVIMGSAMYVIEGPASGFTSIPRGIYWAIVTLTTVGYGDIAPQTPLGQFFASMVMLMGYAIIAVPTGIVTSELTLLGKTDKEKASICGNCGAQAPSVQSQFCHSCGKHLTAREASL